MPLSARFETDFANFYDAVQKAEISLKGFEAGSAKVETQLNRMGNAFSGEKVIQDAVLMTKAINDMGGATRLTEAAQARANRTLSEAVETYAVLGKQAPADMVALAAATSDVGSAASGTAPKVDSLGGSLRQVDGVLASMGVNIGPEIRGLEDLGNASGKSVGQLGLVATAGLAVGAGVAGWKIGRAVSDFFDLDTVIGDATAKLLGFGDIAAAEAGAKADVLARASQHAGVEITSMAAAIRINAEAMKTWQADAKAANDAIARLTAPAESAKQLAVWHSELQTLRSAGLLNSLTADIDSQAFSAQELAARYRVSADAIQIFSRELSASEALLAKNAAAIEKLAAGVKKADEERAKHEARSLEEAEKLWNEYYALRVTRAGTATEIEMAQIKRWADDLTAKAKKAGTDTTEFYAGLAAVSREKMGQVGSDFDVAFRSRSIPAMQDAAATALRTYNEMVVSGQFFRAELEEQYAAYKRLDSAARGFGDTAVDAAERAAAAQKQHNDKIDEAKKKADDAAAAVRRMGGSFELPPIRVTEANRAGLQAEMIRIEEGYIRNPGRRFGGGGSTGNLNERDYLRMLEEQRRYEQLKQALGSFKDGTDGYQDFKDGTPVMLHGWEKVTPLGRGGDGGVTIHAPISIQSVMGNPAEIARVVKAALVDASRSLGQRLPV